jgi:hypothetical protein
MNMNNLVPRLKDRGIFLGWIAGLTLAGALLWFCTQPPRTILLLRTINRTLIALGDNRRLAAPMSRPPAKPASMGVWYSLAASESNMFVFTIIRDGILIPCGAVVSKAGQVEEIIPLGAHAGQVLDRIPQGVMRIYIRRIEAAAAGRSRR